MTRIYLAPEMVGSSRLRVLRTPQKRRILRFYMDVGMECNRDWARARYTPISCIAVGQGGRGKGQSIRHLAGEPGSEFNVESSNSPTPENPSMIGVWSKYLIQTKVILNSPKSKGQESTAI